jgi:hypothetical protein
MSPDFANYLLIAVGSLAGLLVVVALPVWLGTRHALRERQMEHTERMKALEMGVLLPKDQPKWTPEKLPMAIGAGVPIAALIAGLSAGRDAWVAVGMVGTAGVICGTILATSRRFNPSASPGPFEARVAKPAVHDPDAFDVVSSRG